MSKAFGDSRMRVVDLFCGAGGFGLGAEAAGAEVVLGVDKWEPAIATSRTAGHRAVCADVGDLEAWIPLVDGPVDLVIGGPPCQPFSSAGAGQGEADGRDGYPAALAAIRALRPKACALENVRGLLFKRHTAYRERILAELRELFPWVGLCSLNAVDFGVPQNRRRVVIMGAPHPIVAPRPTHRDPTQPDDVFEQRAPWVSMGEALGLRPLNEGEIWHAAGNALMGLAYDEDDPDAWPRRREALARCMRENQWRLTVPSPTISATEGSGAGARAYKMSRGEEPDRRSIDRASCALLLSTGRSRLSHAEAARLQDFPSDHPWQGGSGDIYRQIGNAVPRGLGAAVVDAITQGLRR